VTLKVGSQCEGDMAKDYYETLGVDRGASEKDIRSAYRRLARQHHPDVNRGDDTAEARFKEVNEAYQVLSNAEDRKKYDRFGGNWRNADQYQRSSSGASPFSWFNRARQRGGGSAGAGAGDMFGDIFGGGGGFSGVHVEDLTAPKRTDVPVKVTLEEAYAGATRTVTMPANALTGSAARRLEVSIPAGVRSGSRVHIGAAGQGRGGLDIYLVVTVSGHRIFERSGDDLATTVSVPLLAMVLGGEVEVPMITGKKVALKLPPETENGKVFRLKGKGMPSKRGAVGGGHGDELVTVQALLPKDMGTEQRRLFEQLKDLDGGGD
jgi:curved DNA-binding protein